MQIQSGRTVPLSTFRITVEFLSCSVQRATWVGEGLERAPSPSLNHRDEMNHFFPVRGREVGPLEGVGPENRDFLRPEIATSETHVHRINYQCTCFKVLGLIDFDVSKSITRGVGRGGPCKY